jgi:hypothetical protein
LSFSSFHKSIRIYYQNNPTCRKKIIDKGKEKYIVGSSFKKKGKIMITQQESEKDMAIKDALRRRRDWPRLKAWLTWKAMEADKNCSIAAIIEKMEELEKDKPCQSS